MSFEFPDLPVKMQALKECIQWAADNCITVWIDQNDGGRVRESNQIWIELRPKRITPIGIDEVRSEDTGDLVNPRQDVMYGLRNILIESRAYSRSQEFKSAAWYALARAQMRLRQPFAREKWLKDNELALVTVEDVLNMPIDRVFDDRVEDVALFEFTLATVLADRDTAAIGTWIESVEITSRIRNIGGQLLDSSIQLNQEVMP